MTGSNLETQWTSSTMCRRLISFILAHQTALSEPQPSNTKCASRWGGFALLNRSGCVPKKSNL